MRTDLLGRCPYGCGDLVLFAVHYVLLEPQAFDVEPWAPLSYMEPQGLKKTDLEVYRKEWIKQRNERPYRLSMVRIDWKRGTYDLAAINLKQCGRAPQGDYFVPHIHGCQRAA